MRIEATPEQVEHGTGLLAASGECEHHRNTTNCGQYCPPHTPPPEWVDAAEPCPKDHCQRCGRLWTIKGTAESVFMHGDGFRHGPCDDRWDECDCHQGKRLHDLVVPCEWDGQGTTDVKPSGTWHAVEGEGIWKCDCLDGYIPAGQAVIEHGPLLAVWWDFNWPDDRLAGSPPCILVDFQDEQPIVAPWDGASTHFSDAIFPGRCRSSELVGQYGIIWRKVTP